MYFLTSLSRISHGTCLVLTKILNQNDEMVDLNFLNGGCELAWDDGCGINLGEIWEIICLWISMSLFMLHFSDPN